MIIYPCEIDIKDFIRNNTKVNMAVKASIAVENTKKLKDSIDTIGSKFDKRFETPFEKLCANKNPEFLYGSAILVSTVMNGNDDVFLNEETWKARHTPINTPFNDQHVQDEIIGHIIDVRALDENKDEITDNDYVPEYFDLEVDFVIYSNIFPDIAEDIKENGPKGEKFVSMECMINGFDYALIGSDNTLKVVSRNEDTSFLTRYLRVYGGSGSYGNYRIGRVLRDIVFSGMGNVDDPANPGSIYTKFDGVENVIDDNVIANLLDNNKDVENKLMTDDKMQAKLDELTAENEQLNTQIAELNDAKSQEAIDEINKAKDDAVAALEAEVAKREVAEQAIEAGKEALKTLTDEADVVKASLKEKEDVLAEIDNVKKLQERQARIDEIGMDLDEDKLEAIKKMSDEAFDSVMDFAASVKPEKTEEVTEEEVEAAIEEVEATEETNVNEVSEEVEASDDTEKTKAVAARAIGFLLTKKERKIV